MQQGYLPGSARLQGFKQGSVTGTTRCRGLDRVLYQEVHTRFRGDSRVLYQVYSARFCLMFRKQASVPGSARFQLFSRVLYLHAGSK